MSSYHYSTPEPLPTKTLSDMILFYAHPTMRSEMILDPALWEEMIDEAQSVVQAWSPTTEWERSLVTHGRHIQWLIWQVANSRSEEMISVYTDLDEVVEPWMIEIETLPDYRQMLPAPMLRDDVD